ncbi:F-box domain-containing protein [Mycena indigotica]|uniref:F-box domain-containing protein n=1 Tax=Mycena indigotica TaxID=2126181 RepID=A0A8H6SDB3_9AGAR|nr:F-box domain-containing protein [Mycena indigotica]KAF7297441.1 F-box domain-containing protein [Mycena indigotica]
MTEELAEAASAAARTVAIDVELRQLHARIAVLTAERNSISIVQRMPNEIFARIFSFVPGLPCDNGVMFVCRRWHTLCIGASELWTHIDLEKWRPKLLLTALERSRTRKLCIELKAVTGQNTEQHLRTMLAQSARILDLKISGPKTTIETFLKLIQPAELSVLTRFFVEQKEVNGPLKMLHRDYHSPEPEDSEPVFSLERMAALRHLSLSKVTFHPQLKRVFSQPATTLLTCLEIKSAWLSVEAVLPLLTSSPGLQTLRLDGAFGLDFIQPGNATVYPSVDLPLLESFEIGARTYTVANLLVALHFPGTTRLSICLKGGGTPGIDPTTEIINSVIPPLVAHATLQAASSTARTLILQTYRHPNATYFLDQLSLTILAEDETQLISLVMDEPAWNHSSRIIESFFRSLAPVQLSTITHLHVAGASVNVKTWKALFSGPANIIPAQSLETVTIRADEQGRRVVQALTQRKRFDALASLIVDIPLKRKTSLSNVMEAVEDFAHAYRKIFNAKFERVKVRLHIAAPGAGGDSDSDSEWDNGDSENGKDVKDWRGVKAVVKVFDWEEVRVQGPNARNWEDSDAEDFDI